MITLRKGTERGLNPIWNIPVLHKSIITLNKLHPRGPSDFNSYRYGSETIATIVANLILPQIWFEAAVLNLL